MSQEPTDLHDPADAAVEGSAGKEDGGNEESLLRQAEESLGAGPGNQEEKTYVVKLEARGWIRVQAESFEDAKAVAGRLTMDSVGSNVLKLNVVKEIVKK